MTDNSPVSFADSPLYTRGSNYEFPRQCSHWLGMTELVAFHLAAAAQWLSTSLSKSTHWSSVSSPGLGHDRLQPLQRRLLHHQGACSMHRSPGAGR